MNKMNNFINSIKNTFEEFKNDQKEGKGTLTKQDGSTYVGEFKNDRENGQGTYTYPDGKKLTGLFQNGKLVK